MLAQIHADETKSSLQFASRALCVTNCARVNEILTDAALLKRQKKEIEELKAKLQGSHSEHSEEEILNLRNTLLQTELEREWIAMELEEEKKAQAESKKLLQEQAKKIENLSSMVLYSNRDENRDQPKKGKRRDTWCFGNLSKETLGEVNLEYLGRVVFYTNGILYPDSVVGTDSHTTMIAGLRVAGWGVGGIESEATMLGQGQAPGRIHKPITVSQGTSRTSPGEFVRNSLSFEESAQKSHARGCLRP